MRKLSSISSFSNFKRESSQTRFSRFESLEQRNLLSNVPIGIDLSEFIVSSNEYATSYVTQKADCARSIDLRCKSWLNDTQFESTPSEDANAQVALQNFNDDKAGNPDDYVEQIANKICDSTIYPLVFETQALSEVDGDDESEISIDDEVSSCSTLSGGSGGTGGSSGGNVIFTPLISGGTANSGGSTMMLTSNDSYEFSFIATDDANDSLSFQFSGIPVTNYTVTSSSSVYYKNYYYTVTIDISNPGEFDGKIWVVDSHGATSSFIELPLEVIEIRDFYFVEKAAGQTNYTQLSDSHVLWKENINDIRFTTTPTIDYGDSVKVNQFTSLFNYDVKALEWEWNGSNYVKTIAEPTDTDWGNFNYSVGVYDCKVNIYTPNRSRLIKTLEPHSQYYCVNEIQDVQWETIQSDNADNAYLELDNSNGNPRVFVEQELNATTGTLSQEKKIISAKVSLAIPIPSNLTATVCVKWFDPSNPIQYEGCPVPTNNGAGKRDNSGYATLDNLTLTINSGFQSCNVQLTINGGYAGDNYIIATHPNSGILDNATINTSNQIGIFSTETGSGGTTFFDSSSFTTSSTLTVWRTLWAERDRLTYTNSSNQQVIADLPPVDGLVESELARACIKIREYPLTLNTTVRPIGCEYTNYDILNTARSIPQATNTFWSILLVGAFRRHNNDGESAKILGAHYNNSTHVIGIYNWTITNNIDSWNVSGEGPTVTDSQRIEVTRQVVLHEIGHALGLSHVNQNSNLMKSEHNPSQRLEVQNRSFTNEQIRTIQSHSGLQDPATSD